MNNCQHRDLLRKPGHLFLVLLLVTAIGARAAGTLSGSEAGRRVMVEYIIHFAHHMQWPVEVFSGTDAPFRICVIGSDSLIALLAERLKHHRVNGRRVVVESVGSDEIGRARNCQIAVLGQMAHVDLVKAVRALEFFPVLTVSDAERFAASGGMIEFAGDGGNIALQLNKTMFDRAELKMGDSLFRLSSEVN